MSYPPDYNSRLDELQAAVLRVKLPHLANWTEQRRQRAAWYNEQLANIPGLRLPAVAAGAEPVWYLYGCIRRGARLCGSTY